MRKIRAVCALLCILFAAGVIGCVGRTEEIPPLQETGFEVPRPITSPVEFDATLYFVDESNGDLVGEEHSLTYGNGISKIQSALIALGSAPTGDGRISAVADGLRLNKVIPLDGVCNVYYIGEHAATEEEWLKLRTAAASTVFSVDSGLEAVNVYLNGKEPGYGGEALGTIRNSPKLSNILKSAFEFQSNATLYYADYSSGDAMLIASNYTLDISRGMKADDYVRLIFEALKSAPDGDTGLYAPIPQSVAFEKASVKRDANDEYVIELTLIDQGVKDIDHEIICSALTLSITGYIPNISGVRVYIRDGGVLESLPENGSYTTENFDSLIGRRIHLVYTEENESVMHKRTRPVYYALVDDYMHSLELLIGIISLSNSDFERFRPSDLRAIYISGSSAVVDWQYGFSDKLNSMLNSETVESERKIQLFIYSIINTLCEIPGVNLVWMTEAGDRMGSIGNLYLGNAFMKNPGLVSQ